MAVESVRLSLMPLRAQGARVPLFLAPGAGGIAKTFSNLSMHLSADQPVYAFQFVAQAGYVIQWRSVEDMASECVDLMRAIQPHGPYRLGGYSLGALIAYEMARRLLIAGEQVDFLLNLDMPAPAGYIRGLRLVIHLLSVILRWPLLKEIQIYDHLYGIVNLYLSLRLKDKVKQASGDIGARLRGLHRSSNKTNSLQPALSIRNDLFHRNCRASHAYMPKHYNGDLLVIKTTLGRSRYPSIRDQYLRWRKWVKGNVKSITIDCDHASLIRSPYIDQVGTQVLPLLQELDKNARVDASS